MRVHTPDPGHVASTADPTGSTSYTWGGQDANGKLERRPLITKVTVSRGAGAGVLTYRGAWDGDGQLTRQSMPGGISLVNTYDPGGQLTDMTYTGQVTPVTENIDPDTGETTWTPGTPEADQPWLSWTRRYDIAGRVQAEWNGAGAAFDGVPGVSDPGEIGAPSAGQALAADKRYIYDFAGRLTRVDDRTAVESGVTLDLDTAADSQVPCTRREYSFDKNGNRTKSRTTTDAGGECFYAGGPVEVNHSYDGLDRPVKAGDGTDYVYDAFGRQRVIPESDAPIADAGEIDVSYFDDDLAHTISQNDVTTTFALDALGRRKTSTITGQPTQTRHYGDDSDNPAWLTNSDGMLTRMTTSLDGLGAMVLGDGTAALALANPHGDNVTTVVLAPAQPETQDAVSITGWVDYDEYGRSKTGMDAGIGYGWLGKHERATSIESAGLTLMGVRLHNPVRGAFTTTDPIHGGNTTAYTYPQDPVNKLDLDGRYSYSFKFPISFRPLQSAGTRMTRVVKFFPVIFTIPNSCVGLKVGKNCSLAGSPVRITGRTSTSFTFLSLKGHLEGAGKTIKFSISKWGGWHWLNVRASGPNVTWCDKSRRCARANRAAAFAMWAAFAYKIRRLT